MKDYLTLGPTPCEESCQQVGTASFNSRMARLECQTFKAQLYRLLHAEFGEELSVSISTKSFSHDFGTYTEVCVYFDDQDETSVNQAYWLENNTPAHWDEEALVQLKPGWLDQFSS